MSTTRRVVRKGKSKKKLESMPYVFLGGGFPEKAQIGQVQLNFSLDVEILNTNENTTLCILSLKREICLANFKKGKVYVLLIYKPHIKSGNLQANSEQSGNDCICA